LKRALEAARSAFSYFSIIPFGTYGSTQAPNTDALYVLPVVGGVIGAISGGAALLVGRAAAEPWPAIVAFAGTLILSGAIHVDGFLDSCDAYLASVSPERRLEILKDPRHGTYAVAGMALLTVVWLAALLQISPEHLVAALVCSGIVSRSVAVVAVWRREAHGYGRLPGDIYGAFIVLAEVAVLLVIGFTWH
jgi:adenosylcobinamide-GDP ribazoletransferase